MNGILPFAALTEYSSKPSASEDNITTGTGSRMCQLNGLWDGTPLQCIGKSVSFYHFKALVIVKEQYFHLVYPNYHA